MTNLKNIVIQGIPAGFILMIINTFTKQSLVAAYLNNMVITINVVGWMISVIAYNLMVGIIFAFVYNQVHAGVKGGNALNKGLTFGFLIWLISAVPALVNQVLQNPVGFNFFKLEFISSFVGYPIIGSSIAAMSDRYCRTKG